MIHLDGRTLEGGGQLLRIATGLSALTGAPLRITNIRGNRSGGGGLKQQHLTAVQWLGTACGADVTGAERKSKTLDFIPRKVEGCCSGGNTAEHQVIDIGTPGAISLVFQAILPFLIFSPPAPFDDQPQPIQITIKGGTNVTNSPSYDYMQHVLLPMLALVGLPPIEARLGSRGWSTGRPEVGSITFKVTPLAWGMSLPTFTLMNRGAIKGVHAMVLAPRQVEKDMQRELRQALKSTLPDIKEIEISFEDSRHQNRLYVLLVAATSNGMKLGRDYLYDRRISSYSQVACQMARQVVTDLAGEIEHGGCVDAWLRDQLIVFQALSSSAGDPAVPEEGGEEVNSNDQHACPASTVFGGRRTQAEGLNMSLHAQTAWWVCQQILGVNVSSDNGTDGCAGAGFIVGEDFLKAGKEPEVHGLSTPMPDCAPDRKEVDVERLRDHLEKRLSVMD